MQTKPVTVIETPVFLRQAQAIWDERDRLALVDYIARNPESGDIIPGTGGVRKVRWSRVGSGKRGGARVIYFYHHADAPIYLLLAYAKASRTDMTQDEKRTASALVAILKQQHPFEREDMMTKTFGEDLIESLTEAVGYATGKTVEAKAHIIDVPDVRSIRETLKMSQGEFARAYRIPLPTLKGWEQGRRQPDATAAAYLNVIASLPTETRAVLTQ